MQPRIKQFPSFDRRSFLRLGLAGLGATLLGIDPAQALEPTRARAKIRPAKRCVVLFMHGGPSQIDTFDPKPGASTGGEFRAISSSVSGLQISEHLPQIAARMDRLTLLRSLTAKEGNHDRARYLMHTGYSPQGGVEHPGLGAHAARHGASERSALALPGQISINLPGHSPGYLGAEHAAFTVADASKRVANLEPPVELSNQRRERRVELWQRLDRGFAANHAGPAVEGAAAIGSRAVAMSEAPELEAFDLSREPERTRARYGSGSFAEGCLMARRLLEAGVPFVEVGMRGWDTHDDNFSRVKALSEELDRGMAALIDDLQASGLWSETLLVWLGDFGRTPQINGRGGRNHFPAISSVVLGGGPIRAGDVIGETDATGEQIIDRPVTVPDLFASLAFALGIDGGETHMTPAGRPVTTVDERGSVVDELF